MGSASLIVVWRVPLLNAGPVPVLGFCRFDEIERMGSRRSWRAGVGPRDDPALSLSKGIGPSGTGEQRAHGFGSVRLRAELGLSLSVEEHNRESSVWKWKEAKLG